MRSVLFLIGILFYSVPGRAALDAVASQKIRIAGEYRIEDGAGNSYNPRRGETFDDGDIQIKIVQQNTDGASYSKEADSKAQPTSGAKESHYHSDSVDFAFSVRTGSRPITVEATVTLTKTINGVVFTGSQRVSQTITTDQLKDLKEFTVGMPDIVLTPANAAQPRAGTNADTEGSANLH